MSQWSYFSRFFIGNKNLKKKKRFFIGPSFGSTQENTVKCTRHFLESVPVVHQWWENYLGGFCFEDVLCLYEFWGLGTGQRSFHREGFERRKKYFFRNLKIVVWNSIKRKFKIFVLSVPGVKGSEGLFMFQEVFLHT